MNHCPVCGNVEPDYKCNCIEEATGIKPGSKPRKPIVVETKPYSASEASEAWAEIYEMLICGQG